MTMTSHLTLLLAVAASCGTAAAFNISEHKIRNLMAAVYTPMKENGLELDLDRIPAYAAHLAKINITNVMPCGSNGESLSLSLTERKALAEAWARAGPAHKLNVYMHIGSESLVDSRDLAKHAAATPGISGILSMTPVYFKPTLETLHDFLREVARAAPKLPFWFYHFPDDTGVLPGKAHALLELIDKKGEIPNMMGIKYTDYNLMDFQLCTKVGGTQKYNMLYGRDEQALAALDLGADAAVSSTVQYAPSLRKAIDFYAKGNVPAAKDSQLENAKLCSMFGAFESQAKNVQKNIMAMVGMPVGPSRLPKRDLSPEETASLSALLRKDGLIDKASADLMV